MKRILTVATLLFATQIALAAGSDKTGVNVSSFQLQDETTIPAGSLRAGAYSIRISDHLADRMVVEVQSKEGSTTEKFLGVPAKNIAGSYSVGPVIVTGDQGKPALRGFAFAKNSVIEFVYPKNDAVALAKATGSTVLAIDPASEGMSETTGLSSEDRKIVTLWMLTPTPVGSGDAKASIKAARYEAPAGNSRLAEAKAPVLARLPKTGSNLFLLNIGGFISLTAALLLGFYRRQYGVK